MRQSALTSVGIMVALLTAACGGGGGPTGNGGNNGNNNGGGAMCVWNPAIPASDLACKAPPLPTPTKIYIRPFGWTTEPVVADSTFTVAAYYLPMIADPERRWYAAPEIYIRLSNNDTRAATSATLTALDSTVLDVRSSPPGLRAKQEGCAKLQIDAEGLRSWIWVAMSRDRPKCS